MRFNPKARLNTGRVSHSGGGRGGGSGRRSLPGGRIGGGGLGGLVIVILIVVVNQLIGGGGDAGDPGLDTSRMSTGTNDTGRYDGCETGADANESQDCGRVAVENSLYDYWSGALPQQANAPFEPATMQTFSGSVVTACGQATSQVGPFYCPADSGIYLDTTFFDQVLEDQLGGPDGGFVEYYVIAHEYGHHIQNLLGTMQRVKTQQGPRSDAVRLELQADCYAGMWAKNAEATEDEGGQALITDLTDEDIELAIEAAESVGDDRIQQKTQGQVTEETWTHGSAASRNKWFQVGYTEGTLAACDTWATDDL